MKRFRVQFCYAPDGQAGGSGEEGGEAGKVQPSPEGSGDEKITPPQGGEKPFFDTLSEPLRKHETLKKFKGVDALAESYVNLEGKLGKSIEIPGDDAAADVRGKFYERIGRPKAADEYKAQKALADVDLDKKLRQTMFDAGITAKQYEAIVAQIADHQVSNEEARRKGVEEAFKAGKEALEKEYGSSFDKMVLQASTAYKRLVSPELQARLKEKGFDNDPDIIRLFAYLGPRISGDSLLRTPPSQGSTDPNDPTSKYQYMRDRYGPNKK